MTDRVFPATRPPAAVSEGATNGATAGGASVAAAPNGVTNGISNQKAQPYNQPVRQPYRPPPYGRRHHHRPRPSGGRICCCCCFWSVLIVLILALMAAIAATAMYVIYHPRQPDFSVPSFRIHRLNLTTSADSSVSHLSSLFNFTLLAENPNQHLTFRYDPFAVSIRSAKSDVFLGNGTVPEFFSGNQNHTSFRAVIASSTEARDLDADEVRGLKSDLKKKSIEFEIQMDTKVELKLGKMKSKGVGIRVICQGIKGNEPKGKKPSLAIVAKPKCKVDLRIKIWKFSF